MGGHVLLRALAELKPELDAAVLVAPMIAVNSAPLWPSMAPYITDFMCLIGWRDLPLLQTPPKRVGFASGCQAFGHRELLGVLRSFGLVAEPQLTVVS